MVVRNFFFFLKKRCRWLVWFCSLWGIIFEVIIYFFFVWVIPLVINDRFDWSDLGSSI